MNANIPGAGTRRPAPRCRHRGQSPAGSPGRGRRPGGDLPIRATTLRIRCRALRSTARAPGWQRRSLGHDGRVRHRVRARGNDLTPELDLNGPGPRYGKNLAPGLTPGNVEGDNRKPLPCATPRPRRHLGVVGEGAAGCAGPLRRIRLVGNDRCTAPKTIPDEVRAGSSRIPHPTHFSGRFSSSLPKPTPWKSPATRGPGPPENSVALRTPWIPGCRG